MKEKGGELGRWHLKKFFLEKPILTYYVHLSKGVI